MPPFHIAYVKGWRRCLVLLTVCHAIRELKCLDQIPKAVQARFSSEKIVAFFVLFLYLSPFNLR